MSEHSLSNLLPPLRLLLLGYGHVAQALLPLLASRSEWLGNELGIRPVISGIGTRSSGYYIHPQGIDVDLLVHEKNPLDWFSRVSSGIDNAEAFIEAGKAIGASILIELTTLNPHNGQPALMHIRSALQAGLDVITANKGPVAYAQSELQSLAGHYNVQFCFESTVLDGFPLINLAQFTLPGVGMHSFRALLNTTSSLVLSMIEQGHTLDEAIARAQQLGIAEADPWYDLDGWDAAMETITLVEHEPTVLHTAYGVLSDLVTVLRHRQAVS